MLNKKQIIALVCHGLAICLILLSGDVSAQNPSLNNRVQLLFDYLEGSSTTPHNITGGELNVRGTVREDPDDPQSDLIWFEFAPTITSNKTITSAAATTTITYSGRITDPKVPDNDADIEFCFVVEGSTLTFAKAATLSGGLSGSGLFDVAGGHLIFQGNTTLQNNTSLGEGGAIYLVEAYTPLGDPVPSTLTFEGTATFTGNRAEGDGGALSLTNSTATFKDAIFSNNKSVEYDDDGDEYDGGDGGAVYATEAVLKFDGALTVTGNQAYGSGGAFWLDDTTMTVTGNADFTNNMAMDASGGAIVAVDSTLNFGDALTVTDNTALGDGGGGAFFLEDTTMTVTGNAKFANNMVMEGYGGAIYATGSETKITFENVATFGGPNSATQNDPGDGNTSLSGGAIYIVEGATLTFSNTATFQNNQALEGDGGAMYILGGTDGDDGTTTVKFLGAAYFWDNTSTEGDGGALSLMSEAEVIFEGVADFQSNESRDGYFGGGAIYIADSLLTFAKEATFKGNKAAGSDGGALHATNEAVVLFKDFVTMSHTDGNTPITNSALRGGAVFAEGIGEFDLDDFDPDEFDPENPPDVEFGIEFQKGGTFSWNEAENGGAFYLEDAAVAFYGTEKATTISNNTAERGGAFYVLDSLVYFNGAETQKTRINDNTAELGGAFYLDGGLVYFDGQTVIHDNTATGAGGAFYVDEDSTIVFGTDSVTTLSDNAAGAGNGGAIHVEDGELTLVLLEGALVTLEKGTANEKNDVVLNGGDLIVNVAEGASLIIESQFTGKEGSSFEVTGGGTVSLAGGISHEGETLIDGGTLSISGGSATFSGETTIDNDGTLDISGGAVFDSLIIGDEGKGTLAIGIADAKPIEVTDLTIGEDGKISIMLYSDEGASDDKIDLIVVKDDTFDWREFSVRDPDYPDDPKKYKYVEISAEINFLEITPIFGDNDEEGPNNTLYATVELDWDVDFWEINLNRNFTLSQNALGDPDNPSTIKQLKSGGPGILTLKQDAIVSGLDDSDEPWSPGHIFLDGVSMTVIVDDESKFSGILSGEGSLIKKGTGVLELLGKNTYDKGTTVEAGTLMGNAESLQGDIAIGADAWVEFYLKTRGTFVGTVTGEGSVRIQNKLTIVDGIQKDDKILTFTGSHSYSGNTEIEAGWLHLAGGSSLTRSDVFVKQHGGLGGAGTVAQNVTVHFGGVIQAYDGILHIQQNLTFENGANLYIIADDNEAFVSVSGDVWLDGVTVKVVDVDTELFASGEKVRFEFFKVDAIDKIITDFAEWETDYTDLDTGETYEFTWTWEGTTCWMTGIKGKLPTDPVWLSRANSLRLGMYSPAANIFNRLAMGNTAYSYSGVPYNNGYGPLDTYGMRGERPTIRGQHEYINPHAGLYDACAVQNYSNNDFWVDVVHVQSNIDGDANSPGYGISRTGFLIGYDAMKMSGSKVGLLFGYFSPYLWQEGDRYDVDDYQLGLFVQRQHYGTEILGYAGYAHQQYSSKRLVTTPTLRDYYTGKTSGNSFFASFELAKPRWTTTGIIARPLVGLDYLLTAQKGYSEKGGTSALKYDHVTHDQLFVRIGAHLKKETHRSNGVIRLQYIYEALGRNAPKTRAEFVSATASPLNARGVNAGRHYLNTGAGLNLLLNSPQTRRLALNYDFNLGKRLTEHAVGLIYLETF